MEIEALQAILEDDIQEFDGTRPEGWPTGIPLWVIAVRPSEDAVVQEDAIPLLAELVFAQPPGYPDEVPLVKARSVQGLGDADAAALQSCVDAAAQENIGMSSVYALVAAAQEWLSEKASAGVEVAVDPLEAKKAAEEAEERRLAELRRLGTPVTPATFAPWKQRFYAELAAAAERKRAQLADDTKGKLTGKAFFLQADSRRGDQVGGEEEEFSGDDISDAEDIDYSDDDDDGMLDQL